MDGGNDGSGQGAGKRLSLWRDFPNAVDRDGNTVRKPSELAEAEMILGLCERFHCLPSQIVEEDASLLRLILIEQMGNPEPEYRDDSYEDYN